MSKIPQLIKYILIIPRAIYWFFWGRGRGKVSKIWWTYKFGGLKLCWKLAVTKFANTYGAYDYNRNKLTMNQSDFLIERFKNKPMISIITPVYKIDTKTLNKCIKSVFVQHYKNWELILVDDSSESNNIKQVLNRWASRDNRIKVHYLEKNSGIAAATNFGIEHAKGDFIGFLDHDDEITHDALTWVVWAINKNPQALWFYSDEDLITISDRCHDPHFKPDYSPELLLSIMFTCHFSVYSSKVINQLNGIRLGYDGAQDHDLALRVSDLVPADKVVHIPRVLYHWREVPSSTTMGIEKKDKAPSAGRRAVRDALQRRNLKGIVTSNDTCKTLYMIELQPSRFPEVTIIIPAKNHLKLLKKCLDSIREYTKYPNYNILVIDNNSDDKEFLKYIHEQESKGNLKVMKYDKPFNHSDMNNAAVESVSSELVIFMNNDIEIISDNWLEQLVATVLIDDTVACAGCLLLYKDNKVQHGGMIIGIAEQAGHAHKHIPSGTIGYYGRLYTLQQMSGVTAAFMITKKSAFDKVGGFRADRYPTSYNDVDLCLRFNKERFRCLYNPMVKAYHYESKTRPIEPDEMEYRRRIKSDYSISSNRDPFYNPNLSLDNEQFHGHAIFPIEDQVPELKDLK